ncbi:MAG: MATE family efflux transporter [Acidaminobacteraceae bacterium]
MNFSEKRQLILHGNINRVILVLALPVMANNLIQTVYNLTDTYFVSKLGTTEIAAMQFVWPMIFFMISLGTGLSMAATTLISQYIGSDQKKKASKVAAQIISFSFVFSIILGLLGYIFAPIILRGIGISGEMFEYSSSFIKIMFLGSPTMFLMFSYNAIKTGLGDTYSPMIIGGFSVLLNIILDPIFIFDLGISGAAYATIISRGIFGVFSIYLLFSNDNDFKLNVEDLKFDKEVLSKLLKIGLPSSLGQATASVGFMVLNIFIISFGEATLTAFAIGNRINGLILMPAMGIGSALASIVGQNLGFGNVARTKEAVWSSIKLSTAFLVIAGLPLIYFANDVVSIFSNDPVVLEQGTYYLILVTLSIPLMGIFQIFIGTFQGSGHTVLAMIMMMGRLWAIRLPMILILKNYTNLAEKSVWYSMIISNLIICIVGYIMYRSGIWEKKIIKNITTN